MQSAIGSTILTEELKIAFGGFILRNTFFAAGIALSALGSFAEAQEIPCNSTYTTQRGDTLADIAKRAYDNERLYSKIFEINPGTLKDENVVPIGAGLYIPCLNSDAPVTASGELPPIRPANGDNVKILTGNAFAPYVGDDLPEGGFSTELVHRAMQSGGQPADYSIDVIRDWSAHLQPLLSGGGYDLGYPWYKPDCREYDLLGGASQWRCDNLLFSRPMHQIVMSVYGRAGEVGDIGQPSDAYGMTVCRPSGYYLGDLEAFGLMTSRNPFESPSTPEDCFEMLKEGTVDLVSINADTADRVARSLDMDRDIEEVIDLSTVQTLHVVGIRSDPNTRLLLRRLDKGLKEIEDANHFALIAAKHL